MPAQRSSTATSTIRLATASSRAVLTSPVAGMPGLTQHRHRPLDQLAGHGGRLERRHPQHRRQLADVEDRHLGVRQGGVADGEVDGGLAGFGLVDGEQEMVRGHGASLGEPIPRVRRANAKMT